MERNEIKKLVRKGHSIREIEVFLAKPVKKKKKVKRKRISVEDFLKG